MWTFRGALAIIGLVVAALLVSTFAHAGEPPDPPVPVSKGVGFNDEPAMLALLAMALLGMLVWRRRC